MSKYRSKLPQLNGKLFLTDGGFETTLIFHDGIDLPHFATFPLLKDAKGRTAMYKYFANYIAIAKKAGAGFVLDTPTWRASADWGAKLGYSEADIVEANRASVSFIEQIRSEFQSAQTPIVLNGCIGPRGDGYDPGKIMTAEQAVALMKG